MKTVRWLLCCVFYFTFLIPCYAEKSKAPNFLFIAIDDLKPILGHLSEEPGNFLSVLYPEESTRKEIRKILTPNLDRLAQEGVCFRRAYCPSALCNPSRTALLTGIRTHDSGIYNNGDCFRNSKNAAVRDVITLPQHLRQNGYTTAGTGKIYHHAASSYNKEGKITEDWADVERSWTVWINGSEGAEGGQTKLSPWSPPDGLFSFGSKDCGVEGMDDYTKADLIGRVLETGSVSVTDTRTREQKTIRIDDGRPFFLACGIFRPHLPWIVPQEFVDLFNPDEIHITREYYTAVIKDLEDLPEGGQRFTEQPRDDGQPGKGRFSDMLRQGLKRDAEDGDLKAWRDAVRHYLGSTAFADRCVGRLLDGLDKSPYKENTIVVLWSDHGWMLGTKFRMHKAALWEEAANCVLMIKDPRMPAERRGQVCMRPVNLMDLYPTISALAGTAAPAHAAGQDIGPLLTDPKQPWPQPALTTQGRGNHTLRNDRYRLICYGEDYSTGELYDHQTDPTEYTNQFDNPELKAVRDAMQQQLEAILLGNPSVRPHSTKRLEPLP